MSSNEMENGRTEKFEFRSPQIKVAEISEDERYGRCSGAFRERFWYYTW